jgi:hypothetical protein
MQDKPLILVRSGNTRPQKTLLESHHEQVEEPFESPLSDRFLVGPMQEGPPVTNGRQTLLCHGLSLLTKCSTATWSYGLSHSPEEAPEKLGTLEHLALMLSSNFLPQTVCESLT